MAANNTDLRYEIGRNNMCACYDKLLLLTINKKKCRIENEYLCLCLSMKGCSWFNTAETELAGDIS